METISGKGNLYFSNLNLYMISTKKHKKEKSNNFALKLHLIKTEEVDLDTNIFSGEIENDNELWGKDDP